MIGNPMAFGGPSSWGDVLSILGATARDMSPGSGGQALPAAMDMMFRRRMAGLQMGAMGQMMGLFGSGAPGAGTASAASAPGPIDTGPADLGPSAPTPAPDLGPVDDASGGIAQAMRGLAPPPAPAPVVATAPPPPPVSAAIGAMPQRRGLSLSDPQTQRTLAMAAMMGVPGAKEMIDMIDKAAPHIVTGPGGEAYNDKDPTVAGRVFRNPTAINGWNIDVNDPRNAGQYFGKLPDGVIPDGHGGVVNASGLVPAMGAQAEAAARAKTFGEPVTVPNLNGSTTLQLGRDYFGGGTGLGADAGGGSGAPGAAPAGGPAARPGTSQSPADAEYQKTMAGNAAGRFKALQDAGNAAPGEIARLQAMRGLLKGYEGGKYAPQMLDMASAANSIGIPMSAKMTNAQVAQALVAQMTMGLMKNPDTGANMFPRVTNFEMQQFTKAVPGLMQTAAGRDKLVDMYTAVQQRAQDISARARTWNQRFGRIDAADGDGKTFQDRLDAWSGKHPLFGGIAGAAPR